MTTEIATSQKPEAKAEGPLFCALTGKPVSPEEAYWAPPLITTKELLSTIFSTLFSAPGNLGQILMAEQPNVPYAPDARPLLAQRRSAEQVKLLLILLLIAAVILTPVFLLAMR
ncbi:hypothetical protein F8S13_05195 [Chloroflexia bacterium SDU3-3]|nr:hypothetical protein F8S13_05195 [Chloroflexia bacterium SDU3-3]